MIAAAARRFFTLLAAVVGGTAVLSLLLGLLLDASPSRSVAVGLYLVGCAFLLGGFFIGNRGIFRVANEEGMVGATRSPWRARRLGLTSRRSRST